MNNEDTKAMDGMLTNPFYAVTFADHLFRKHGDLSAKEDWIAANAQIMKDIGVQAWLEELLEVVSLSRSEYDGHDMINPALVVNISDRLQGEHEPLVTRKLWVQANEKLIDELGAETWLYRLLEMLETGGPVARN